MVSVLDKIEMAAFWCTAPHGCFNSSDVLVAGCCLSVFLCVCILLSEHTPLERCCVSSSGLSPGSRETKSSEGQGLP